MRRIKKYILPIICITLVLTVYFVYRKKSYAENQRNAKLYIASQEYNELIKELRNAEDKFNEQLEATKNSSEYKGGGSTIVLIAIQDKEEIEEVIDLLDWYGYCGVLAIDDNNFGAETYLDEEEINDLLLEGYELVLKVDCFSDIEELYDKYVSKGYDIKGFYFAKGDITSSQRKQIKSLSVDYIISPNTESYNGMLYVKALGSYEKNVTNIYESNVEKSSIIALTIDNNESGQYSYSNVEAMLRVIRSYENRNLTQECNLTDAKTKYEEYQESIYGQIDSEITEEIDRIKSRLEELEEVISRYNAG